MPLVACAIIIGLGLAIFRYRIPTLLTKYMKESLHPVIQYAIEEPQTRNLGEIPLALLLPNGTFVGSNYIAYVDLTTPDKRKSFSASFQHVAEGKNVSEVAKDFFCDSPFLARRIFGEKRVFVETWICDPSRTQHQVEKFFVVETEHGDPFIVYPDDFISKEGELLLEQTLLSAEMAKQQQWFQDKPRNCKPIPEYNIQLCTDHADIDIVSWPTERTGEASIRLGSSVFDISYISPFDPIRLNALCVATFCEDDARRAYETLYRAYESRSSVVIESGLGRGRYVLSNYNGLWAFYRHGNKKFEIITFIDDHMLTISADLNDRVEEVFAQILLQNITLAKLAEKQEMDTSYADIPGLPMALSLPDNRKIFVTKNKENRLGIAAVFKPKWDKNSSSGDQEIEIFFPIGCSALSSCSKSYKTHIISSHIVGEFTSEDSSLVMKAYKNTTSQRNTIFFSIQINGKQFYAEHMSYADALTLPWLWKILITAKTQDFSEDSAWQEFQNFRYPPFTIPKTWNSQILYGSDVHLLLPPATNILVQKEGKVTQYHFEIMPEENSHSISVTIYGGDISAFRNDHSHYTYRCKLGSLPSDRSAYISPLPCGDGFIFAAQDEKTRYIVNVFGDSGSIAYGVAESIAQALENNLHLQTADHFNYERKRL